MTNWVTPSLMPLLSHSWMNNTEVTQLLYFVHYKNMRSKNDYLVQEVKLLDLNPTYTCIRCDDGRKSTVSLHGLVTCLSQTLVNEYCGVITVTKKGPRKETVLSVTDNRSAGRQNNGDESPVRSEETNLYAPSSDETPLRRSQKVVYRNKMSGKFIWLGWM